ncbi:G protein-activated inward rectifier potassium channel 4 [Chlorella vulgaris]
MRAAAAAGAAAAAAASAEAPLSQRNSVGALERNPSAISAGGMSQTSQGTRPTMSCMEFPMDPFNFGDIEGMGRPVTEGGLLHHDYFNRGKGFHEETRERLNLPALVESGRHAGRSRVQYQGAGIGLHMLKRDFFITVLQTPIVSLLPLFALVYLGAFFFWGIIYYLIVRFKPGCIYGASSFVESWTFAIITQMTIGYGNTGPQNCATAAVLITIQTVSDLLLNAVILGLIFAKVASPKHRAFSIYISDSAVITRRDGILKFMFRVADIRRSQVIEPRVKAYLYTWGEGRVTAEGERIQVRCEQLYIDYIDGMLLLPLIIEHTIDERSPLCGHTYDSLAAMNAEVVVTFEATTEMGNPFFARQSYLAQEINWSCHFAEIIRPPQAGMEKPRYSVDLNHFHDLVVNRAKRAVPYPLLGENTLVLSDVLCVRPAAGDAAAMELVCRVADTYPNQMVEVGARIYLYRWRPVEWCAANPSHPPFTLHTLQCGYKTGRDRLYLRLPQEVVHRIDAASPLASWLEPGGLSADADSEIVVLLQGYLNVSAQNRMRQRTYRVNAHVRYGFTFSTTVRAPSECRDGKPRVRWSRFFDIEPVAWSHAGSGPPTMHLHTSALNHPAVRAYMAHGATTTAPESHQQVRAQRDRSQVLADALDKPLAESPRARWVAAARMAEHASAAASAAAAASAGAAGEEVEAALLAAPHAPAAAEAGSSGAGSIGAGSSRAAGDPWRHLERRGQPARHQSGPPDLSTLSVAPSVPLDRYAAALSRRSMDGQAESSDVVGHRDAAQEALQQQQYHQEQERYHQQQERYHERQQQRSSQHRQRHHHLQQQRYHQQQQRYHQQQQQQEQGAGRQQAEQQEQGEIQPYPGQYQQQQPLQYQSDLLSSDLTAGPGVSMDRYAAMVAAAGSPDAAGLPFPPQPSSSTAGVGGSAAMADPASTINLPPRPPGAGTGSLSDLPAGRRADTSSSTSAAAEIGGRRQAQGAGQHVGSWPRRRSLASLHAIFEQVESQADSQAASDSE